MQLTNTLAALLSLPLLSAATGPSYIASPTNGTHVAPGARFAFDYIPLGDYCATSRIINVYMYTSKPKNFAPAQTWITGTFLGQYSANEEGSIPGPNLPATLTMPDFSKSPGGFGTGKTATNIPVYLTILEETATCDVSFLCSAAFIAVLIVGSGCPWIAVRAELCYFDL